MEVLMTDEVREIIHDMAEYSQENMICSFDEEELIKEYLSIERTEDYRAIVSILYAIIYNDRIQKDEKEKTACYLSDIMIYYRCGVIVLQGGKPPL